MAKQREAFVVTPTSKDNVHRLNKAVRECEVLPIIGESGCGKTRFLDWWWQSASSNELLSDIPVQPEEIILIEAELAPSSAVPMACVIFTKLLASLQELESALVQQRRLQPLGRIRSWITESQTLSLVYEHVHPLFEQLQPQAVVVTNAHLLDERSLNLLLELRRAARRGFALAPRCALILCAQIESSDKSGGRLSKIMNMNGETRAAWPDHIQYSLMKVGEFGTTMLTLVKENLHAEFASDVDVRATLQLFGRWTHANWWLIERLVAVLDTALGPVRESRPRIITTVVIANVQNTWLSRNTST